MIDICPTCGRRLLSHALAACGWCGAVVPDEEYQENARVLRKQQDLDEQLSLIREQQRVNAMFGGMPVIYPSTADQITAEQRMRSKIAASRADLSRSNASSTPPGQSQSPLIDAPSVDPETDEREAHEQRFRNLEL